MTLFHNAKQVVLDSGLITITEERPTGWISYYENKLGPQEETSFQADQAGWLELANDLGLMPLVERKVELKFWAKRPGAIGRQSLCKVWVETTELLDLAHTFLKLCDIHDHVFYLTLADEQIAEEIEAIRLSSSSVEVFAERAGLTIDSAQLLEKRSRLGSKFPSKGHC